MAAVFALSLVPAGAFAADATTGRFPTTEGTLTIKDSASGETYSAWRMLTLASFSDGDPDTDKHMSDAYAYVIKQGDPWLPFFTDSANAGYAYFDVDQTNPVKINGENYFVVSAKPDVAGTFTGLRNPFADDVAGGSKDETSADEWTSNSLVQKFAQDAVKFASDNDIAATATGTGTGADLALSDGTDTSLPLGYYVVDSTQGTLCSLDTLNPDVAIADKNEQPTLDKLVQEDSRLTTAATQADDMVTAYQKVDDAEVGEAVYFKSTVTVEDGAKGYVLHDYMEPGLTWDKTYGTGGVKVWFVPTDKVGSTNPKDDWTELSASTTPRVTAKDGSPYKDTDALTTASYYTLDATGADDYKPTDAASTVTDTFKITFADDFLTYLSDCMKDSADPKSFKLVVEYSAKVNEDAVVGAPGNKNKTYLEYGERTGTDKSKTPEQVTTTYTWPLHIYKYTTDGSQSPTEKPLAGAVFEVYDYDADGAAPVGGKKYAFVKLNSTDPGYDSTIGAKYPQYMVVDAASVNTGGKTVQTAHFKADGSAGDSTSYAYTTTYYNISIASLGDSGSATHEYYTALTTGATGKVVASGFDAQDYYLKETQAPNGYNVLPNCVKVTVDSNTDTVAIADATAALNSVAYVSKKTSGVFSTEPADVSTLTGGTADTAPIMVLNQTGPELPSTGGIGTTIFYVAGTVLVVGAAVMLVAKRRMGAEA